MEVKVTVLENNGVGSKPSRSDSRACIQSVKIFEHGEKMDIHVRVSIFLIKSSQAGFTS